MTAPEEFLAEGPTSRQQCAARDSSVALVIPSLGAITLERCLRAVADLDPAPDRTVVVLSGESVPRAGVTTVEFLRSRRQLGFAAAVNFALGELLGDAAMIGVLNDDAVPSRGWLGPLRVSLDTDPGLAAVQGTVSNHERATVDGRGIAFDPFGLPIQLDHGQPYADDPEPHRDLVAVSGTAALFRSSALRQAALENGAVFDPSFGSYHEDLDLGLRLRRLGWRAAWVADAPACHLGSTTGRQLRWRHPWWLLANRWRALAGNLSPFALIALLPRLLRGELRASRLLVRSNPRAAPVSLAVLVSLPILVMGGWRRRTAGPRLSALPGVP
jgi:GT2 family glycosyltransferase